MASKAWAAETDPSDPDTSWDGSDGSHGMGWDQATRGGHQGRLRNVTEKLRFDEISVGFPVRIWCQPFSSFQFPQILYLRRGLETNTVFNLLINERPRNCGPWAAFTHQPWICEEKITTHDNPQITMTVINILKISPPLCLLLTTVVVV